MEDISGVFDDYIEVNMVVSLILIFINVIFIAIDALRPYCKITAIIAFISIVITCVLSFTYHYNLFYIWLITLVAQGFNLMMANKISKQ